MENKLSESYKKGIGKLFKEPIVFYDSHTDKMVNVNLSNLDISECKTEDDVLEIIIKELNKLPDDIQTLILNYDVFKTFVEEKKPKLIIKNTQREKPRVLDRRINLTNDKPEEMNAPMPLEDVINIMKENGYKNIHISGPISNLGKEKAKIQFDAISHMLKAYGFICTHTFSFLSSDKMTKQYYLKESIRSMLDKDAVVRFNLSIPSEGAKIEEEICNLVKIPHFNIPVNFNK